MSKHFNIQLSIQEVDTPSPNKTPYSNPGDNERKVIHRLDLKVQADTLLGAVAKITKILKAEIEEEGVNVDA